MKSKSLLLSVAAILWTAARVIAQQPAAEPTLVVGSEVKPDALAQGEWIKGEAPTAWEPGKVYMLECWATWCGPCVAAIPHVNELHQKYTEKGLRVIGVNVWEDGKDKVTAFVEEKGDGMSYPVVYTGRGSAFEKDWLAAAGVRGIPHAFLVRDGKLVLKSHPSQITDEVIEALLEGGDAMEKVKMAMEKAEQERAALSMAMREFSLAANKKDIAAMEAAFPKVKELDKSNRYVPALETDIALAKKDWDQAVRLLAAANDSPMVVFRAVRVAAGDEEVPPAFVEAVAGKFAALTEKGAGPTEMQMMARLQWKLGKKEEALTSARAALEKAQDPKAARTGYPLAPFEKFASALEAGKMPTEDEFTGWVREAVRPRAQPAAPVVPKPSSDG